MTVAGLLVFVPPSLAQLICGIVTAILWGFMFAQLAPYPSLSENSMLNVLNFAQVVMLLGAMALKVR